MNRKYCIENHKLVFIIGDLNYRIDLPNETVRLAVEKKEYAKLKEHDELMSFYKMYSNSPDPTHILYS